MVLRADDSLRANCCAGCQNVAVGRSLVVACPNIAMLKTATNSRFQLDKPYPVD